MRVCIEFCVGVFIGGVKHAPLHDFMTRNEWKDPYRVAMFDKSQYTPHVGNRDDFRAFGSCSASFAPEAEPCNVGHCLHQIGLGFQGLGQY